MEIKYSAYTRTSVKNDPSGLYIFTDNTNRTSGNNLIDPDSWYYKKYFTGEPLKYPNTTSACIRGLNNAFPVSTQKFYIPHSDYRKNRWFPCDLELFKQTITNEFSDIENALKSNLYDHMVLPQNGLNGGGIASLDWNRVPELCKFLYEIEFSVLFNRDIH